MAERVWDRYLSEQDRAHLAANPAARKGAGTRPVLMLVDLYRWAFGDKPEPLLEAVKRWPSSCGLAGWTALPHIERLLAAARDHGIPVIYVTGLEGVSGWRDKEPRGGARTDPASRGRRRQRYEIMDEIAPVTGEVILHKNVPSAFNGTPLLSVLRELDADTLIVSGESTSGCIRATVVDAKSHRYKVLVPEECVFDRHEAPHAINLFDMDQKYADVLPLDEVVAYLDGIGAARGANGSSRA